MQTYLVVYDLAQKKTIFDYNKFLAAQLLYYIMDADVPVTTLYYVSLSLMWVQPQCIITYYVVLS